MERVLQEIFALSRGIQENTRVFYKARIIEFLSDILLHNTEARKSAFISWLDSGDREYYTKVLSSL